MAESDKRPRLRSLVGQISNLPWGKLGNLPYQVVRWLDGLRHRVTRLVRPVSDVAPRSPSAFTEPPTTQSPDGPPAHWLAHVQGSGPSADWLARVQQGAPHLLEAMTRGVAFGLPSRAARRRGASTGPPGVADAGTPSSRRAAGDTALPVMSQPTGQPTPARVPSVATPTPRMATPAPRETPVVPRAAQHRAARLDAVSAPLAKHLAPTAAPPLVHGRPGRGPAAPLIVAAQPTRPAEPSDMPSHAPPSQRLGQPPWAAVLPLASQRPLSRSLPSAVDDGTLPTAYRMGDSPQLEPDATSPVAPRAWANPVRPPGWPEPTPSWPGPPPGPDMGAADTPAARLAADAGDASLTDYENETQGRWPTLPLDDQPVAEDWEASRRAWERRQRLDREQEGRF